MSYDKLDSRESPFQGATRQYQRPNLPQIPFSAPTPSVRSTFFPLPISPPRHAANSSFSCTVGIHDKTRNKLYRTGFAVYTPPPSVTKKFPDPMPTHHAQQIARMDPTGARRALFAKRPGSVRVGDVLMVTTRRAMEPFSGVCISIRRAGIETAILLRTALAGTGVEMWFKIYSRNVAGIDIVKRRERRARRARLTYMRQPKHDMGAVEHLVREWRRTRVVIGRQSSKTKATQAAAKTAKKGKR
jgi:large subunit ribosomal protein L19